MFFQVEQIKYNNLEAKIDTYLEVKCGAKWDTKMVTQMDAILDTNLDANMA